MNKNYKFTVVALVFLIIAVILFLFGYKTASVPESFNANKMEEIKIGGKTIKVEIADTVEKQVQGLSGRQSMPEDQGMLFVFDRPGFYFFWMKDMNFSLDFIWIKGDIVMEITENVRPEDYEPASTRSNRGEPPKVLSSENKVDKVLEVNAGVAEKLGIKAGDKAEF